MYTEDNLIPISALQHFMFCERQCALIHIERLWAENRLTVEGSILHEKVHDGPSESRAGVRIARSLPLRSLRLGLVGIADVVEFHTENCQSMIVAGRSDTEQLASNGAGLPGDPRDSECRAGGPPAGTDTPAVAPLTPPGRPFPVEYKHGRPKSDDCDRVQLCAQALCLEEMFGVPITQGSLYYGRTRHRCDVDFDENLRRTTEQTAERIHRLLEGGLTPTVRRQPKCRNCSMVQLCLPEATSPAKSASRYLQRTLRDLRPPADGDEDPTP